MDFQTALWAVSKAAAFAVPWNHSFNAIEGFLDATNFCAAELANHPNHAALLTSFVNHVFGINAKKWSSNVVFLRTEELRSCWLAFFGTAPPPSSPLPTPVPKVVPETAPDLDKIPVTRVTSARLLASPSRVTISATDTMPTCAPTRVIPAARCRVPTIASSTSVIAATATMLPAASRTPR